MIYDDVLKQVWDDIDVEILAYEMPYQKHKVDYKNSVAGLWEMLISDDVEEDKSI